MTSLAFSLGVLPLAIASGASAASQNAIGTGVNTKKEFRPLIAKYLAEFIWPNLEKGLQKSGRAWKEMTTVSSAFVIAGDTQAERDAMRERVRRL